MARDLTSGVITELDARELRYGFFVDLGFDSAPYYLWTGIGPKVLSGKTYQGIGDLGSFGRIEESQVVKANGIALLLSGFNSSTISLALAEPYQGRSADIFFAVFDSSGNVIADPYGIFSGSMDVMEIEDQGETGSLTVTVENELIDLEKPRLRNYTDEDQQAEFPGDLGCKFIAKIQDYEVIWKDKQVK